MESTPEEVATLLAEYSIASKALHREIIDIMFYMRGSVTRDEAWRLTPKEREMIIKRIEKNIEQTEKTGLPLI